MKPVVHRWSNLDHIPSLRELTEARFARGSTPPTIKTATAEPPERPTCRLDVTALIKLLDVDAPEATERVTRKIEPRELRTLGVLEHGELPSIAWAPTSRVADVDDRLAPTMIVDLADPPATPLHVEAQRPPAPIASDDGEYADYEAAGEPSAPPAVAAKAPIRGFVLGMVVGLAAVAAAFTALGVLAR